MSGHPVAFTDTARQDVREFAPDPEERLNLVRRIVDKLSTFPRAHPRCRGFGTDARRWGAGDFTIVYDVGEDGAQGPAEVVVRHVWPSRGEEVAALLRSRKP